jgi:putative membrane protein
MKLRDDWMFRSWAMVMALFLAGGAVMAGEPSDTAVVLGKLHHSNQMEIDMGRLAQQRGQANGVTTFGTMLVHDHTAADQQVVALAVRENIDLTAALPASARTDDRMAKLRTLKGMAFDKAFARAMLDDHTRDVDEAKAARDRTTDGGLKVLLASTIPTLEQHRDIAQRLVDTLATTPNVAGVNMPAK